MTIRAGFYTSRPAAGPGSGPAEPDPGVERDRYTPDELPVMGTSPTVPGQFYAFGFSGGGFQLGPGVVEAMAELLATGATDIPLA